MEQQTQDFTVALTSFITECEYNLPGGYSLSLAKGGIKYAKIVKSLGVGENKFTHDQVWCFVDKTTGDILKAATWQSPAKGSRGNIFETNRMDRMTPQGPASNK